MDEKKIVRNLIIVIFFLVIIYSILRVGAGLDLSFGPYIKQRFTENKDKFSTFNLLKCLMDYYKEDAQQAKQVGTFILNNREEKIKENIRRKVKK